MSQVIPSLGQSGGQTLGIDESAPLPLRLSPRRRWCPSVRWLDGAIACEQADWDFDGNGVYVESGDRIRSRIQLVVGVLLRSERFNACTGAVVETIKGCAQVDKKWIGSRAKPKPGRRRRQRPSMNRCLAPPTHRSWAWCPQASVAGNSDERAAAGQRDGFAPPLTRSTVKVCWRLRPAAPARSRSDRGRYDRRAGLDGCR